MVEVTFSSSRRADTEPSDCWCSPCDLCHNERQVSEIFRLLDWTVHLRVDLEKRAEALLRFQSLADLQNGLEQYGGPGV